MSLFAKEFGINEIGLQPVTKIPWSTLITIIVPKSSSHEEMLWYINQTHKNGWARSQVELQFKAKAYQRSLIEPDTSNQTNSLSINSNLNDLVKDTYILDFIGINDIKNERDLQNSLMSNIQRFILELGQGFSFVSEKYRLPIDDTQYEIGTIINKRKTWGSKYIQNLANDLKEYGNSFSIRNLHYMKQFAEEFSTNEIMQQPVAQIPWGTLITAIIPKSSSHKEMLVIHML